jgi:hypothetical protein
MILYNAVRTRDDICVHIITFVGRNKIYNDGVAAIADALTYNRQLQKLNLGISFSIQLFSICNSRNVNNMSR